MRALTADRKALAKRRAAVRAWAAAAFATARRRLEALAAAKLAGDGPPLVTGLPGAATTALAVLLNRNGVRAVLDEVEADAVTVSSRSCGGAAAAAMSPLNAGQAAAAMSPLNAGQAAMSPLNATGFGAAVHVVRDPLAHVPELAGTLFENLDAPAAVAAVAKTGKACPRVAAFRARAAASGAADDRLALAAAFWLDGNDAAARAAPLVRLRLEDLDAYALFAGLGRERRTTWPLNASFFGAPSAPPEPRRAWARLREAVGDDLAAEVRARAAEYGYAHDPDRSRRRAPRRPGASGV